MHRVKDIGIKILKAISIQAYSLLATYIFYYLKMQIWGTTSSSNQVRMYYIACGLIYLIGLFFILRFATETKQGMLRTFQSGWMYLLVNSIGIGLMIVQYANFAVSIGITELGPFASGILTVGLFVAAFMSVITSILICFCNFPSTIHLFSKTKNEISNPKKFFSIMCYIIAFILILFSFRDYLYLGTGLFCFSHCGIIMAFTFVSIGLGLQEKKQFLNPKK